MVNVNKKRVLKQLDFYLVYIEVRDEKVSLKICFVGFQLYLIFISTHIIITANEIKENEKYLKGHSKKLRGPHGWPMPDLER